MKINQIIDLNITMGRNYDAIQLKYFLARTAASIFKHENTNFDNFHADTESSEMSELLDATSKSATKRYDNILIEIDNIEDIYIYVDFDFTATFTTLFNKDGEVDSYEFYFHRITLHIDNDQVDMTNNAILQERLIELLEV